MYNPRARPRLYTTAHGGACRSPGSPARPKGAAAPPVPCHPRADPSYAGRSFALGPRRTASSLRSRFGEELSRAGSCMTLLSATLPRRSGRRARFVPPLTNPLARRLAGARGVLHIAAGVWYVPYTMLHAHRLGLRANACASRSDRLEL